MQIQAIPSKIWEQLSPCDNEAMGIAIECMEELEQYRALGTVEELKEATKLFEKTKIVGAENIIIIRKDGTYEVDGIDILEAIQKQVAKKPNIEQKGLLGVKMWHCPVCNKEIISDWNKDSANNYCHHCGQKLDWEEGGTSD